MACRHTNTTTHFRQWACDRTDGCVAVETHCRACKKFLIDCVCGKSDGTSGWSRARWRTFFRKKYPLFYGG